MVVEKVAVNPRVENSWFSNLKAWNLACQPEGDSHEVDRKGLAGMTSRAKWRNLGFVLLALSLPILISSAPARSQDPEPANSARPAGHRPRTISIDDQVKGLAKNLDLTETQQSAVKRILQQRLETLRMMRNSPGSDQISQFQMLQARTVAQIRAVLNDEQKKKYNPLAPHPSQSSPQPSVEDWMKATTPH
jgi:hypothetical protein